MSSPSAEIAETPARVVKGKPYRPDLPPPQDFVPVVDNPYMPFVAGSKTVFEGASNGQRERNAVVV